MHFVREKVVSKEIFTPYVKTEDQLADMFTKSLGRDRIQSILSKLGMIYSKAPAWGRVERRDSLKEAFKWDTG